LSDSQPTSDGYGDLFSGAARLGVLCAGLDVPWTSMAPFVGAFSERLKDYFELSVDPRSVGLGMMTKGEGQAYAHRVARFMEENGIPEKALRRFLVRAKYFEYRNVFFKAEADGRGLREFSTYFRRRPPVQVAHAMLADSGVDGDSIGLMEAVAEVLEKQAVHFVGSAATRSGHLQEKVYFSQPDVLASWDRIHTAATLCGVSDADWAPLAAIRPLLEGHTSFVSLSFAEGVIQPGFKLDVHNVSAEAVENLLLHEAEQERADLVRTVFEHQHHSYVGIRITPGEAVRVKTYALG
jgi:hypothetical protein